MIRDYGASERMQARYARMRPKGLFGWIKNQLNRLLVWVGI